MTTFTMQDLNNLPNTPEEDEAMDALARLGAGVGLKDIGVNAFETPAFSFTPPHAPQPQASAEVLHNAPQPTLTDIINSICTQLQLLATVISSSAPPQPSAPESTNLQDCVSTTLEQADWFRELVEEHINGMDFDDRLETHTERYCENYFSYSFDPRDHFDIDDAVADRVDDKLDGIVEEKVGEVIEEVVAEKLSEASVSISF